MRGDYNIVHSFFFFSLSTLEYLKWYKLVITRM